MKWAFFVRHCGQHVKLNTTCVLECILKAIHQMTENHENIKKLLKTYFTAGVTPEFAETPEDADALKGGLELYIVFNLKYYIRPSKYSFK